VRYASGLLTKVYTFGIRLWLSTRHKEILIMSDKPKKGLDRRDLIVASVGAAAVFAANAGSANAQDSAASPVSPTPGLHSDTTAEAGNTLVFVLFHRAAPEGVETYSE
jgi:hypothetical protein